MKKGIIFFMRLFVTFFLIVRPKMIRACWNLSGTLCLLGQTIEKEVNNIE